MTSSDQEQSSVARLHALRNALRNLQASGAGTVPIAAVLQDIERSIQELETPAEALIEQYKSRLKVWEASHLHQFEWSLENFRQTINLAQTATKYMLLIHGGAAIALLAFLGRVWGTENLDLVPFTDSMRLFAVGLFISAAVALLAYVVQYGYGLDKGWLKAASVLDWAHVWPGTSQFLGTLARNIDSL